MPRGRFGSILPIDNIYLVESADDLPNILSPWVIYNMNYKSEMFYSKDGINLKTVGPDESLIYFLGE